MPSWSRDTSDRAEPHYAPLPPPHRLSSIDDPYALTLTPRHSAADLDEHTPFTPSQRGSYIAGQPENTESMPIRNEYEFQGQGSNNLYDSKRESDWLAHTQQRSKRTKRIVVGSVIAVFAIIIAAIAVSVTVSKHKANSKTSSGISSSSPSGGVVQQSDPNDPSTFVKDSRLKKSFYGFAYTPENSQYPDCGNKLVDVITDIQLLSQLTDQIRLYGADCNQSALVLEAIKQTKVDMKVWLGNYPIPTDPAPYARQRDAIIEAIQTYGTDHIAGVTVGNEYMLNWLNANGATDPNSAIGNTGAGMLIANITDTRNAISALNLATTIPVGTADAGSFFNTKVLQAVDYGMANIHAWFANVTIDAAAGWVADFFEETDVAAASALSNQPKMYIAETGWPTGSKDLGNESNGPSTASEANLQIFLNDFVCEANKNGTGYFYFEYADEPWKDAQFGGVEGHWGVFYPNRTLKNIEIPSC